MALFSVISLFVSQVLIVVSQLTSDKDLLLNYCIDAALHVEFPAKVDSLHDQCLPWKNKACCTHNTTYRLHTENVHNFDLNHCYNQVNRNLSDGCRRHFNQDNCFYECEPHIGLWVVKTKRKIASERFVNVPLCASDCDTWFDACKEDYTCVYNWPRNFQWKKGGVNVCPKDAECQTFQQVYKNASNFCENVWDGSWKYTPDSEKCMRLWFDGDVNPNEAVAKYYIEKRFGGGASANLAQSLATFGSIFLVFVNFQFAHFN